MILKNCLCTNPTQTMRLINVWPTRMLENLISRIDYSRRLKGALWCSTAVVLTGTAIIWSNRVQIQWASLRQWAGIDQNRQIATQRILLCLINPFASALDLHNLELTDLPKELFQLKKLKWLNLNGNQISRLSEEFGGLINLETLGLSHNRLTRLPESIVNLKNLQTINLNYNQITYVPRDLKGTAYFMSNPCPDPTILTHLFNKKELGGSTIESPGIASFLPYLQNWLAQDSELMARFEPLFHAKDIETATPEEIQEQLEKTGEVIIRGGWQDHYIYFAVSQDLEAPESYTLRIYNTGSGSDYHPSVFRTSIQGVADSITEKHITTDPTANPSESYLKTHTDCRTEQSIKTAYLEWRTIDKHLWSTTNIVEHLSIINSMDETSAAKALYQTLKTILEPRLEKELTAHQKKTSITPQKIGNCAIRSWYALSKSLFGELDSQELIQRLTLHELKRAKDYIDQGNPIQKYGLSKEALGSMSDLLAEKRVKKIRQSITDPLFLQSIIETSSKYLSADPTSANAFARELAKDPVISARLQQTPPIHVQ